MRRSVTSANVCVCLPNIYFYISVEDTSRVQGWLEMISLGQGVIIKSVSLFTGVPFYFDIHLDER